MPDPRTIQRLKLLRMSASDLVQKTGWAKPVIEEYLSMIDSLITLAELLDVQIDKKLEDMVTDFVSGTIPVVDDGFLVSDSDYLSWDIALKILSANILKSIVEDGTAPLIVTSKTLVSNLNADLLDGQHASYFLPASSYKLEGGTAQGQLVFWDSTSGKWVHTEITEIFWDDTNKRVGIGTTVPTEALQINGRVVEHGTFAGIHCHDASTAQAIAPGSTYTKITAFTDNEPSANCTSDAANDKITITKPGYYHVSGSVSFSSGTNNVEFLGSAFLNGSELNNIHWTRKISTAGDVGNAGFTGIIDVTSANLDLDLRMRHNNAGSVDVTISYSNLNVFYLGET